MENNNKTFQNNDWKRHNNEFNLNNNYNATRTDDRLHKPAEYSSNSERSVFSSRIHQSTYSSVSSEHGESRISNFRLKGHPSNQPPCPPWLTHTPSSNSHPASPMSGQCDRNRPPIHNNSPLSNSISSVSQSQISKFQSSNANNQTVSNSDLINSQSINFQPSTQMQRPPQHIYIPRNIPPSPMNYSGNIISSFRESRSMINQLPSGLPSHPVIVNPSLSESRPMMNQLSQRLPSHPFNVTPSFSKSRPMMNQPLPILPSHPINVTSSFNESKPMMKQPSPSLPSHPVHVTSGFLESRPMMNQPPLSLPPHFVNVTSNYNESRLVMNQQPQSLPSYPVNVASSYNESKTTMSHLPPSFSSQFNVTSSSSESRTMLIQPPPNLPSYHINPSIFPPTSLPQNFAMTSAPLTTALSFSVPSVPFTFPLTVDDKDVKQHAAYLEPSFVEEQKLSNFLQQVKKFSSKNDKIVGDISIVEFRNRLSHALSIIKTLSACKENMVTLLDADEKEWGSESSKALMLLDELLQACKFLNDPENLQCIKKKLVIRKKKREMKKKLKLRMLNDKMNKLKQREEIHQDIDKWLDSIKEKNLKLKREAEMKKEADCILAEVRRKIHEAKHLMEKIKVFEKLRNARQTNAMKKGLVLPEYDEKFQSSISKLKDLIFKQLSDYENEEKALKVMLEAEQEGQLEEEALWKVKKMKALQKKRQKNILRSLFGDLEEPSQEDPIHLFYQFQTSGSRNIESLVQIRQQWDSMLSENGESVPYSWVVPVLPSSSAWEAALLQHRNHVEGSFYKLL